MSEPFLATEGVTKRFGAFTAVRNVSVAFPKGELTAIIGPNGAGKSTYFNLLTGAFPPTEGKVVFEGQDITGQPQHRFVHLGIAKSFQITNVFPQLSVFENVRLAAQALVTGFDLWRPRGHYGALRDTAERVLGEVGLTPRRNAIAAKLSHGEQRALEVGMALAASPRLLLLDEPTAGMSPEETRAMMDLIVRLAAERTVILVEHKMKLVMSICTRILVLHQGEVLAMGAPDDVRRDDNVRRVYLGQRAAA
jgi:branched-chain amino acid transport system ATP-binding protein